MTSPKAVFPETADIETSSRDYARRFSGAIGEWFLRVQESAVLGMMEPYPGARVLDVGGGHGQITRPLARRGYSITVLSSSAVCKDRIRDLVDGRQCDFDVGSVVDLPYDDRSFDVVLSFRLLPHVGRWSGLLHELSRVARKAVIVDYPSVRSLNYVAPHLFRLKKNLEGNTRPYVCFEESQILRVFESDGFVRAERYPQFFLPMVLHRALGQVALSKPVEALFRSARLTTAFGSPVILKVVRRGVTS